MLVKVIAPAFVALTLSVLVAAGGHVSNDDRPLSGPQGLTVHEWGTFTTVAGPDGHPMDWLPLGGAYDLPCFVDHFGNNRLRKYSPGELVSYEQARSRLLGKVRMETPVLYFYSPEEKTLNARVDFPGGLITEWYPQAAVSLPPIQEKTLAGNSVRSFIQWNNVKVLPGRTPNLPVEERPSHYYAARATDAAPVQVNGKDEKFLFYRGVGSFPIPLSVQVTSNGQLAVATADDAVIPSIVLFENRGGKIAYRVHGRFQGRMTFDIPAPGGDFASLRRELEAALVAEGMYTKEARAMVETWRDSWFEEGTRIFYIVPRQLVDSILPLRIDPAPASVARAFVGRIEIITPERVADVEDAIAANDKATLAKHGRFLGPIAARLAASPEVRAQLDSAYNAFLGELSSTCSSSERIAK